MELKNPDLKITPADFGLKGTVVAMQYQSYFVKKGWLGFRKTIKGSGFLDTSSQELHFTDGKLVSEKGDDFSDGYNKIYLYGEDGRITEIKRFAKHPYTKEIREYDSNIFQYINSNTFEQDNYIGYDRNFSRSTYTIRGNILEEICYTEIRKTTERKEYEFNESGKLRSETEYGMYSNEDYEGPEDTTEFIQFSPDAEHGNSDEEYLEQGRSYAEGEEYVAFRTIYTYDHNNCLIEERHYQENDEQYKLDIRNDAYGNPVLIINYEDNEIVDFKKFIYKYDKHGNWVYRKEYEVEKWKADDFNQHKAKLKFIVKRKISYI